MKKLLFASLLGLVPAVLVYAQGSGANPLTVNRDGKSTATTL